MLLTAGGLLAGAAIGGAFKSGADMLKGTVSNYYAEKRARDQAELDYLYAERYAKNSPSWNVQGLRDAGLNPILAASSGFSSSNWHPSSPSIPDTTSGDTGVRFDPLTLQNIKILKNQNESLRLDNEIKSDNLETIKSENEVRRLKAEAEASILRPVYDTPLTGKGKEVAVLLPSKSFKALQKAIADDYDLRSEKYMRETIDAVMRYGTDVLKLLPAFRKKEIIHMLQKNIPNGSNAPNSGNPTGTLTNNGPKSEPVFVYD